MGPKKQDNNRIHLCFETTPTQPQAELAQTRYRLAMGGVCGLTVFCPTHKGVAGVT